ncbi:SCO family protein [Desulfomicrobium escambiense]|uniref:SCO family protein n=1 Tax=Desulfomicrobium escambiense TaxID=29503 RepID=UPI0004235482|nr:SCO family protein [Desulfomicrobium escambiense]
MRPTILILVLLLLPLPLAAQTAVQQARQAAQASTAQETATAGQAEQAVPPAEHSGHDMSGHVGHDAAAGQPASGAAADHSMHAAPAEPSQAPHVHQEPAPAAQGTQDVGVTEKLGGHIAADARFLDETGRPVTIGQIIDKPTIVVPIYFSCPNVCAIIQSSLTQVLPDVTLTPGVDFQVVSVSFDETDTPELAASQRRNYLAAMDFKYPESGWRFLTGDEKNIRLLTDSLGFGFRRSGKDFLHPVVVMAVSPKGKIVRYLYGTKPLAFDLTMAATEAGKEQVGLSVKRVLAYCFSYDPEGKRYAFNFMKITATGILVILGVLLVSLLLAGRKKRRPRN